MRGVVMSRSVCVSVCLTLAMSYLLIVGCSTASNMGTVNHSAGPREKVDYSMWEEFARAPASDNEDEVSSRVVVETINVQAAESKNSKFINGKACGDLVQGESTHTALNNNDANYFLRVDCESVIGSNGKNKSTWVRFADGSTVPQQRSYLTRWRRKAVSDNTTAGHGRRAVPYICFRGQMTEPLCTGATSSTAKLVQNFTSRISVYKNW